MNAATMTLTLSDSEAELVKIVLRLHRSEIEQSLYWFKPSETTAAREANVATLTNLLSRLETQEQETK